MLHSIRKTAITVGVIGAAGLGGSQFADAAGTSSATRAKPQSSRETLSADVAAKVKAAALAKVPGATVLRTEAGGPYSSAYHAHVKTSDGTLKVVLVNASFEATDVVADQGRGAGRGHGGPRGAETALTGDAKTKAEAAALAKVPGATVVRSEQGGPDGAAYHVHVKSSDGTLKTVLEDATFTVTDVVADRGQGHGGPRGDETPLTGDTKAKVEAAVLAKYPGATIVRSETNGDAAAPYEAHITTSAGTNLEVLVSKEFAVVDARERPAHR